MKLKIKDDAEVYTDSNQGKHIGSIVSVSNSNEIIDADSIQAQRNAIRPRVQREVIVA